MSSGLTNPPPIPMQTPVVTPSVPNDFEGFIDQRLRHTRRQLKTTDIAGATVTLAIGVLAYLFAAAMIDHWLIAGGLGVWGRTLLWLGLVGAGGTYFVLRVLPPLLHRVNPIFAAATIEKSRPTLKNSLINFLLLRSHRQEMTTPVYRALESRAAADLSHVQIETAVDRAYLIRTGCVLAAFVALFALYLIFSPKNPLRSAARILLPWSAIDAPTRVTIRDVRPGDATVFLGESVSVSAEAAGLDANETLLLVYSSADGQIVDQTIPMTVPAGEYRYQCSLPPGKLGLQQDYEYFLTAGDCRTGRHRITVQIAPAIAVEKVDYHYPGYTGLADQTVERQGDLRAIEGTEVTLHARANTDVKPNSAEIDLGCSGRQGVRMNVEGKNVEGKFTLRMSPDDPKLPKYDSYMLRMADLQGRENLQPIRHRIDVIRDLPPEVFVLDQPAEDVQVPENGSLDIKIRAEDPDFGLRRVAIRAERDGRSLSIAPSLEKRRPEKPLAGEFMGTVAFVPQKLGLKAGDRAEYWAEAEDNREPVANRSATEKRWIVVVAPESQQSPNEKQGKSDNAENKTKNDAREKPENNGDKPEKSDGAGGSENPNQNPEQNPKTQDKKPGESGEGKNSENGGKNEKGENGGKNSEPRNSQEQGNQPGGTSDKPSERVNPDTDPGTAMDEILKDQKKEQQKQQQGEKEGQGDAGGGKPGEKKQGEEAGGKPGDMKQGEKAQGENAGGKEGEKKQGEESGGKPDEKNQGGAAGGKPDEKQGENGKNGTGQTPPGAEGSPTNEKTPGASSSPDDKGSNEKSDSGEKPSKSPNQRPSDTPSNTSGDRSGNGDVGEGQKSPSEGGGSPGSHTPAKDGGQLDRGPGGDEVGENPGDKPVAGKGKSSEGKKGTEGAKGAGKSADGKADENGPKQDGKTADAAGAKGQSPDGKPDGKDGKAPGKDGKADDKAAKQDGKTDAAGAAGKPSDEKNAQPGAGPGGKDADGKPTENAGDKDQQATPGDLHGKKGKPSDAKVDPRQKATGQGGGDEPGKSLENPPEGGQPGRGDSKGPQAKPAGVPGGGNRQPKSTDAKPPEPPDNATDEANAEYARRQTELALQHLRDVMAQEKPELLDRLGWTKDDARRFLDRWEAMRAAAAGKDAKGEAARKQLNDAIRSLGLRPQGTELRGGGVAPDAAQKLRDPGRFAPPADWAEQLRAYTRGVGGADRQEKK